MSELTKKDLQAAAEQAGVDFNKGDTNDALKAKLADAGVDVLALGAAGAVDSTGPGVADREANAELEHSAGGATTRGDRLDAGVPMVQGDGSESVGPEDALGEGATRGEYGDRVPGDPHTTRLIPGGGQPITDDDGNVLDYEPRAELVSQSPS